MASMGLKRRLEAVLSDRSVEIDAERTDLVLEFLRLVIQVLARSELSEAERLALESRLVEHLALEIDIIRSLIDIAFRPEYRAVVDRHEVLSFGTRFGDKLVEFVRAANEEMTRSIAEVVQTARAARAAGTEELEDLRLTVGTSLGRLGAIVDKMETTRRSLWTDDAEPATPTDGDVAEAASASGAGATTESDEPQASAPGNGANLETDGDADPEADSGTDPDPA